MGVYTKRAASLVVMGVGGGAFYPPAQGALADHKGTQLSYILNAVGFLTVALYGAYMRVYRHKLAKRENLEAARTYSNGSQDKIQAEDQKIEEPVHLSR
jgi:FHS family L-fucose permease-like MFS transporter